METIDGVSRAVARRAVEVETAEEEWRHFKVERVVAAEGKPHAPVLVRVHSSDGIVHCSCQVFATCNICCHVFEVLFGKEGFACASHLVSHIRGTRWVSCV